jgi:NAD(P)-dependent dehydrogenase (short-subunit alcohol dehydrogenase family)
MSIPSVEHGLDVSIPKDAVRGRTVIVTGGSTGIGRATVLMLATMGAHVLTNARSEEHLGEARVDFSTAATPVRTVVAELSEEEGILGLFKAADDAFGGSLDVLICNAALPAQSAVDSGYDEIDYVVRTNLLGYLGCTREAVPRMGRNSRGRIVLVGSMSADVREPDASVYVATKSGIQGFAESLRKEVGPLGIGVSLVQPGAVGTDMQPDPQTHGRQAAEEKMLLAEDVARAVIFCLTQPSRADVVRLDIRPHAQEI